MYNFCKKAKEIESQNTTALRVRTKAIETSGTMMMKQREARKGRSSYGYFKRITVARLVRGIGEHGKGEMIR
jgi:hypothetical protein